MKLRNKKTGEIGWLYCDHISVPKKMTVFSEDKDLSAHHWDYNSLAELNKEWEDYEEPVGWCVTMYGGISRITKDDEILIHDLKEIGNYFNDKESAYDALDKLKAWKRLKDRHFKFDDCDILNQTATWLVSRAYDQYENDIKLLFGGEE